MFLLPLETGAPINSSIDLLTPALDPTMILGPQTSNLRKILCVRKYALELRLPVDQNSSDSEDMST